MFAAAILIAFGIATIVMGPAAGALSKRAFRQEQIVGTPDMTPAAIAASAKEAGLPASVALPTCSAADKPINDGASARCFASYMRITHSRRRAA